MFIELHQIQNFAPSNLNRDDTNNPKDCEFGGVRRARISSQCLKRAIRKHQTFTQYTRIDNGIRTRKLADVIYNKLINLGKNREDSFLVAYEFVAELLGGIDQHKDEDLSIESEQLTSKVLYFFPKEDIDLMVSILERNWDEILQKTKNIKDWKNHVKNSKFTEKKNRYLANFLEGYIKKAKKNPSSPDLALFGRMLANEPNLSVDAACQVAHAISTHAVNMDIDFFTAVDDLAIQDETGAGMMGTSGFNSACFYRYACIDFNQLKKNLSEDVDLARNTVEAFLRASAHAVPSGKQNSHAAQNPPYFLMAVVRADGLCWSLANAFDQPVYPGRDASLEYKSVKVLDEYWQKLNTMYGGSSFPVVVSLDGKECLNSLKDAAVNTIDEWVQGVLDCLPEE